jgi:hypothetical protein
LRHRFIIISAICWLGLLAGSAAWNVWQIQQARQALNLHIARSFFGLIVLMRDWNALHGGVYVPVSERIQPNPYLEVADRDIVLPDGRMLTKVNPAYMTRLVAELAEQAHHVQFHITSLAPVNPNNHATVWETEALMAFEAQASEFSSWDQQAQRFRYMAPLVVQPQCLKCHEQHGYALGDVRGGISVTFHAPSLNLWPVGLSHSALALIGLAAGLGIGLYLGWVAWPVEYYDTNVASFHPQYQFEYAVMVGASYELDGNWGRAEQRLSALGQDELGRWLRDLIHRSIAEGQDPVKIGHLISLAEPLDVKTEIMEPFSRTTTP